MRMICPRCRGMGLIEGWACPECNGRGTVEVGAREFLSGLDLKPWESLPVTIKSSGNSLVGSTFKGSLKVCPACGGLKMLAGYICSRCGGSGLIIEPDLF